MLLLISRRILIWSLVFITMIWVVVTAPWRMLKDIYKNWAMLCLSATLTLAHAERNDVPPKR